MRVIYCAAISLVLAGCASQEQIAARQATANGGHTVARHTVQQTAPLNRADDDRCRRDRGAPGSIAYVACRMKLASNRRAHEGQMAVDR